MFPQPLASIDHGLCDRLSIGGALTLGIIQKSVPRSRIHLDFILFFVFIEGLTKHLDFRLCGTRVIRTVVAQERNCDALQIFRIGKHALVINHSRRKGT